MEPIDANAPLSATLAAFEWNEVMAALHERPFKFAAPIIAKLSPQLQAAGEAVAAVATPAAKPNGEAHVSN